MALEIFGDRKMNRSRQNAEVAAADPPPPTGVGLAHLQVRSLRRSIEFYSTVLGLHVLREVHRGVERFVTMGARGCTLVAIHEELDPTVQICRRGVKTLIVSDLDRVRARVWESGIAIVRDDGSPAQIQRSRNRRLLYVRDPDGYELELVEVMALMKPVRL
jgi:catechol 2,3-dioxygenase-like lactoylglutathione lyase family enzyme